MDKSILGKSPRGNGLNSTGSFMINSLTKVMIFEED